VLNSLIFFKRITKEPQELSWNNLAHDTRPPLTHLEPMTIKVTLRDGTLVTNPEQFTDEREEYDTELSEDTTTS
jgi:hypothetical protein